MWKRWLVVGGFSTIFFIIIGIAVIRPEPVQTLLSLFESGPESTYSKFKMTRKTDIDGNNLAKEAIRQMLHPEQIASLSQAISTPGGGSATSGSLFLGKRNRNFNKNKLKFTDAQMERIGEYNRSVEKSLDGIKEHLDELYCNHWAVVTTIFEPSEAVIKQAKVPGWCLVVVGDKKGPKDYIIDGESGYTNHVRSNSSEDSTKPRPNFIFLSPEDQEDLAAHLPIIEHLPWNHFGRKNVGYLYAILHGAQIVWDFDDDNGLLDVDMANARMDFEGFRYESIEPDDKKSTRKLEASGEYNSHFARQKKAFLDIKMKEIGRSRRLLQKASRRLPKVVDTHQFPSTCQVRLGPSPTSSSMNISAFNPYPLMGAPSSPVWPRGYPLTFIRAEDSQTGALSTSTIATKEVAVVQSLANHDPDIDAIYRLTMPLPFDFPSAPSAEQKKEDFHPVLVPDHLYAPYNAQATLHLYSSLWSLLLPITVHGRVSDIWRGYFMQKVCKSIGLKLLFAPPIVKQDRNDHNYLADFQSELPLYLRASKLLEHLNEFSFKGSEGGYPPSSKSLPGMIEHLWVEMYERGYIEMKDVRLVQAWLESLMVVGYKFPSAPSS